MSGSSILDLWEGTEYQKFYNFLCVSARGHRKRTGIEIDLLSDWPNENVIYASPFWKKAVKLKVWELGDTVKESHARWVIAMEVVATSGERTLVKTTPTLII